MWRTTPLPPLLPPPNVVCFLPPSLQGFVLTNDLARRQSSRLRFGSLPPPYGAITPNHTGGLSQRRTPTVARYWLTICLAIILFQTVLTICRSDALAMLIDLESAAHRASKERLALMVERGKSEQEREKMKHDRELWEKAREDRVPHNAFWDAILPAPACSAYGKREYSSTLQNIPEGWTAIDACINMPIEIKGATVRRPNRCAFVKGSPHVHGYWMVDWDEPSCKPRWYNYQDVVSVNRPLFARTSVFTHLHRDAPATSLVSVESRESLLA